MRGIINIFIFLLIPLGCLSQGEFNNWYFGNNCGITFNSGTPVLIPGIPFSFGACRAEASVSDSAGNFLFLANGTNLYNRNKVIMPNGYDLLGSTGDAQNIAVQDLTYHNLYYFFTVGCHTNNPTDPINGLRYSVIDMELNGGLGDIVPGMKNIPLPMGDSAYVALTATRHQNNKYAWVVALRHGKEQRYLAYLIDSSGVNTTPVVSESTLKNTLTGGSTGDGEPGFMRISPDGQHLFCSDSLNELCHFNTSTGVVTPRFRFWPGPGELWGVSQEFSIDSRYVYFTSESSTPDGLYYYAVQYDMINTDSVAFMESQVVIGDSCFCSIQMAPDGKIYLTDNLVTNPSLHRINNPSAPGTACNYQKNVLYLEGNRHFGCLPQFLQRYKVYISSSGDQCQGDSVIFGSDIWPPADSIRWDFGDPGSGTSNYSDLPNPFHIYSNAGSYQAECRVRHIDKRVDTARVTVVVLASPQPVLGNDLTICTGESVTFDAGFCAGCTYLWTELLTGTVVGTGQTLTTSEAGHYEAAVTGSNGCTGRDSVWLNTTPVPVVTNSPPAKAICTGEPANIVLTSNVPGATFNWTVTLTTGNVTGFSPDSGLVISQVLVNQGSSPGEVTYHITPKAGSCTGILSDYAVTVDPANWVNVSITASGNNLCAGDAVTFTATPSNGGTTPVFQWKVNGSNAGTNSPVFTYTPSNGDMVICILTSSIVECITNNPATSNSVAMTVNPLLPVSVSITESSNPVCSGTPVTFTATPTNGGTTPAYQWRVNGVNAGANSPVFTYLPSAGDLVTCILTSSIAECIINNPATSNSTTMTVDPLLPVSVSIAPSSNPVCAGTAVTFTATPANEGTAPSYQWMVNGSNAGTNNPVFTYTPSPGDLVTCMLTSSIAQCITNNPATSNLITMVEIETPQVSFTRCFDSVTTIDAIPIHLKGGIPLGGTYSGPGVDPTTGVFTPSAAGAGTKTITYSYTNVHSCTAAGSITIIVQFPSPFTCGGTLTDIRDGKVYPTLHVGSRCWMGSNLNYGSWIHSSGHQRDNCTAEKYCPDDLEANCQGGAATYQWEELIQYGMTAGADHQGLCPAGWHIPSAADYQELIDANQGSSLAGTFLTDLYLVPRGFEALLQGMAYMNTAWAFTSGEILAGTLFWTSSPGSGNRIITRGMNNRNQSVSMYESTKTNAFPVRCVQD